MVQDLFFVGSENNTNDNKIFIAITTENGTFVLSPLGIGVFYGLPPGNYPVGQYIVSANQLKFSGNIDSVYSEWYVQSDDDVLIGTITVNPALTVPVSIGSYGGQGSFELPAGTTSVDFKIPIADYGTEDEGEQTSRIAKIVGKPE